MYTECKEMRDNYECDKSPCGEHLQGTYYEGISGQIEFIYTGTKDKYKGRDSFCKFIYCPFCGESLGL